MNLTSISTMCGIFIPIIVAYISTRHNFKKHPRQEFTEDVISAREFEKVLKSKDNQLIKDRVTQKFMLRKNVNFLEAKYFYSFVDMESWIQQYLHVKKYITPIYNIDNNITEFKLKYSKAQGFLFLISYIFLAFIAITPLIFMNQFMSLWKECINSKNYLLPFNMIIWPLIFISISFIKLHKATKISEAISFLKKFKKESIKID
ncbi:hypothetical protein [Acinetobacter sp. TUM15509]|uniref:hypothetical protein n=1 Tax=Acinetobacter sp. TUM15509 TaxID=2609154 RepID=UPI00125E7E38|nr:hypothetical protein [Acinetobacter sp. TUM15509]